MAKNIPVDEEKSELDNSESDLENGSGPSFTPDFDTDNIEIEDTGSKVASAPAKNILVIAILVIGAGFFLYKTVFQEDPKVTEQKKIQEVIKEQPVEKAVEATKPEEKAQVDVGVVETPALPDIEGIQPPPPEIAEPVPAPVAPAESFGGFQPQPVAEPAPQPVQIVENPVSEPLKEQPIEEKPAIQAAPPVIITGPTPEELAAQKAAKRKSSMLVVNGGGSPSDKSVSSDKKDTTTDGTNTLKNPKTLSKTSAQQVTATAIGDLDFMIAQGKMIDAVLETAINTDLPGSLRAVITRDIYAESGKNVLIPRGSRLIGSYNNSISKGQRRVIVTWGRVIRPDGVDIAIDSPGTDQLGRAGVSGFVDNKYLETIRNSLLLSAVSVVGTALLDGVQGSQTTTSTTTTDTSGSTSSSQTGKATDFAVLQGVSDFSDTASGIVKDMLNSKPTISVNQGTLIKVFVNKDLVFPESAVGSTKFVN